MAEHDLKAVAPLYAELVKGRRVDLRALGERDIRPGDNIIYHEVDPESRGETGETFRQRCVMVSPHFPLSHNSVKEANVLNVLGLDPKKVKWPVPDAKITLEVDDGLFRALYTGKWNIDIRPGRPDIAALVAGDIVKYLHVTPYNKDSHVIGRIVNHNDKYDMRALFGNKLQQILEGGLLVVGLDKKERLEETLKE